MGLGNVIDKYSTCIYEPRIANDKTNKVNLKTTHSEVLADKAIQF